MYMRRNLCKISITGEIPKTGKSEVYTLSLTKEKGAGV